MAGLVFHVQLGNVQQPMGALQYAVAVRRCQHGRTIAALSLSRVAGLLLDGLASCMDMLLWSVISLTTPVGSGCCCSWWSQMVVQTTSFVPNEPLPSSNLLYILEQIPGEIQSADMTATLVEDSYWGSCASCSCHWWCWW